MRIPGRHKSSDDSDWVTQATKTITGVVDTIHDAAVVPLTTVVRAIVYGVLAFIALIVALILLTVGFVRLTDMWVHNIPSAPDGVWLTYLVCGAIFILTSLFVFTKRKAK